MTKDVGLCPSSTCDYAYVDNDCRKYQVCPKCSHKLVVKKSFSLREQFSKIHLALINRCPMC